VYLRGDTALISERLAARVGHFAGAGLLPSLFELLDPPADAFVVDVTAAPDVVAARALAGLGLNPPRGRGTR
jgi:gluconokinase